MPSHSRLILTLLIVFLTVGNEPLVSAASENTSPTPLDEILTTDATIYSDHQQNNTTIPPHENPEKSNEDGDLDELETYLQRQLASRLAQSSIDISQGEYERGQSLLGDEYNSLLEKYVDVAGETGDEQTAKQFNQTRQQQRSFAQTVQEYRETYKEYQQAKQNGNEQRARELARRLDRLSDKAARQSNNLTQSYDTLAGVTETNFTEATTAVQSTTTNITQQQATVRETEFEATTLTIDTNQSQISFTTPLEVDGQLTTEDGTALDNRIVLLAVGQRQYRIKTDSQGRFSFQYRPITLPVDTDTLVVRYVPRDTAPYLGSNATVHVDVVATNATITLESLPATASFGERVQVRGHVAVNQTAVSGLPIRITLGGISLGTVRTTTRGAFTLTTQLPVAVSPGERSLQVQGVARDRAVYVTPTTAPVSIAPTKSNLSANATAVSADTIRVRGQLTTADGQPVTGEPIVVRVDGTTRATVTTNEQGRYEATLSVQRSESNSNRNVSMVVQSSYTGPGNLNASNATVAVVLPPVAESRSSELLSALDVQRLLYLTGGLLVLGGAGLFVRRRLTRTEATSSGDESSTAGASASPSPSESIDSFISRAQTQLEAGNPDTAIEIAYATVRQQVATTSTLPSQATHWEFYRAYHEAGLDAATSLRELTQVYEAAAFGPESVPEETARQALDIAVEFVGESAGSTQAD